MTPFLIAGGVTATILVFLLAFLLGMVAGTRRGVDVGFSLAREVFDEGEDDSSYFQHYGGMIDAGKRGEN